MFGSWEDLVKVDGDAEGDEEEAADAGPDPVWRLKGGWSDELGPEGEAAVCKERRWRVSGWLKGGFAGGAGEEG